MTRSKSRWTLLREGALLAVVATLLAPPADSSAQLDLESLQDEAVQWLQEYIRINTINPPGNEIAAAEFFARIFDAEGS